MDYEFVDYIEKSDAFFHSYLQRSGRALAKIEQLSEDFTNYMKDLSPDAAPSPEFCRSFARDISSIFNLLEVKE